MPSLPRLAVRPVDLIQQAAALEILAVREEELRVMRQRSAVGSAGPNEVAQAEVSRAAAVTALSDARRVRKKWCPRA